MGAAFREAVLILLGLARTRPEASAYAQLPHGAEAAVQGIGVGSVSGLEGERAVARPRLTMMKGVKLTVWCGHRDHRQSASPPP